MIYRKWSLLTGPAAILGGIVGTLVVANFIFFDNDPFSKPPAKKQEPTTSKQEPTTSKYKKYKKN